MPKQMPKQLHIITDILNTPERPMEVSQQYEAPLSSPLASSLPNTPNPPSKPPWAPQRQPVAAPVTPHKLPASSKQVVSKRTKMASQYKSPKPRAPLFTPETFKPCYVFFFGRLMDPDYLWRVTRSAKKPTMRPGWITGFKPKKWGLSATLVPLDQLASSEASGKEGLLTQAGEPCVRIGGMFWRFQDYWPFGRIEQHMGSALRGHRCRIHILDVERRRVRDSIPEDSYRGNRHQNHADDVYEYILKFRTLENGVVFVWAGEPQSPELGAGKYNISKWQEMKQKIRGGKHEKPCFLPASET